MEQKVSGQTSFESPIRSHVFLSSLKYRAQRQTFSHCQESQTLVILEEKMRGEKWR